MKKNKIVNKIGILVLAVMLSILSSITVLASEPEEAELGPRQDISKNLTRASKNSPSSTGGR